MIKKTMIMAALGLSVQLQTFAATAVVDTLSSFRSNLGYEMLESIEPSYLNDVVAPYAWNSNWFVGVSGGASAFMGKPLGCEDLFGRTMPALNITAGKWFTPEVGGRLAYQGFRMKNADIQKQTYHFAHADFMWNVSNSFSKNKGLLKWNIIPFVGAGIIHNDDAGKAPFAFSYGVNGQYRISKRLLFSLELGGMTTFQDFDGKGKTNRLGDNMFSVSAGIVCHIGKVGWKKVVDASPYITQNQWLKDYVNSVLERNHNLNRRHEKDAATIAELKKILEIEGLLNLYGDRLNELYADDSYKSYPRNDYSGLNSLRARLAHKDWDGKGVLSSKASGTDRSPQSSGNCLNLDFLNGQKCIGAPIHFFFNLGTSELTDVAQIVNVDELARIAKEYDLNVSVVGSADSSTGTPAINDALSTARANYISSLLKDRGVDNSVIIVESQGGIDDYSPIPANRQVAVCLYLK